MPDLIDGRYRLIEVIASGGMATVWRAHDTRLDRRVAIKRPHPAPPGDPTHARIEREARSAAALSHPNLITVYDVGRDAEGPYLVMELVEGPTLSEVAPGMSRTDAADLVARMADALSVIHSAGIVHRDVKPSNILISDRGPLLTDFGVAVSDDTSSRLTMDGSVVATPSYASPEQLAGRPATDRSDVFSLGVILYQLLTGRLPFTATDRSVTPTPIGDPYLDDLVARTLSADPQARPQAERLAEALRASAPTVTMGRSGGSTVPMATRPPPSESGPPPPASSPPRHKPALVAGVAVIAIAVLAGAILTLPDNDPSGSRTGEQAITSTNSPATTEAVAATSTTSTTGPTTTTLAAVEPPDRSIEDARARLESELSRAHPSALNPKDVRDQMEKADAAIAAVDADKEEEAGQKLREIARRIDETLDGEVRHDSLDALVKLAEALGIYLGPDGGEQD